MATPSLNRRHALQEGAAGDEDDLSEDNLSKPHDASRCDACQAGDCIRGGHDLFD